MVWPRATSPRATSPRASRHRLGLVSDPDLAVLRRLDGTEVARCTVRGATWEEILRAAEEGEGEIDER
jgi:hypothetical protein